MFSLIFVLLSVSFFTLYERKLLGYVQMRKGPNKPSIIGLFVPFADAVKLMVKENNSPSAGHHFVRLASPFFYLFVAFIFWCLNPCEEEKKYGVLIFLCISSVGVFALLFCG